MANIDEKMIYDIIYLLRERAKTGKAASDIDDKTLLNGAANFMEAMIRKLSTQT